MTENCPPSEIEQLRAENKRLKSQFAELTNSVAEIRDKMARQAEREPDPDVRLSRVIAALAYESVLGKAQALAYPPDPAIRPEAEDE